MKPPAEVRCTTARNPVQQYGRSRRDLVLPAPGTTVAGEHAGPDLPAADEACVAFQDLLMGGPFARSDLRAIRREIHELAVVWRLPEPVTLALEMVATELVANVVVHAQGQGRLRLSRYPGWAFCQVTDVGPGVARPYTAGWQPPFTEQASGRGLWIARCFSDRLTIDSSPLGTTVTAKIGIPA